MAETVTLFAVGDVCLAKYIREGLKREGPAWAFEPCRGVLEADILFGNLECQLFRPRTPEPECRTHTAFGLSWSEAMGLPEVGFDVLNLANNHIMDYGPEVALETLEFCRQHGIAGIGLGASPAEARAGAVLERSGIKVGFLGYAEDVPGLKRQVSPGPAYMHEPHIVSDIRRLREQGCDVVAVSLHADLEFVDWPAPHRVALARRLIDAGATLVLQHHPHVTQGIEEYNGGLIAYSLGNFVFPVTGDEYMEKGSPWTGKSFVLRVELDRSGYCGHEIVPVSIGPDGRPAPMGQDEREDFLRRHEQISADLKDPQVIEARWLETARRYLRINISWLVGAVEKRGMDYAATEFMCRLLYDENLPWVKRIVEDLAGQMPPRAWETA